MATIIKKIGTGSGADYSTITAWEADLSDGGIYSSGDDAIGECQSASTFTENVTLRGTVTDLDSAKLTVKTSDKHNGTAGTGAILSGYIDITATTSGTVDWTVEWLEITGNSVIGEAKIRAGGSITPTTTLDNRYFANLLIYGANISTSGADAAGISVLKKAGAATNCIIYDLEGTNTSNDYISGVTKESTETFYVYNCTIHDIKKVAGATGGDARGTVSITYGGTDYLVAKNCIVGSLTASSGGSSVCYDSVHGDSDYNLSSDSSAGGSNSLTSKTPGDQFVSTVAGSEDLHLKSDADAIDAGVDLETAYNAHIEIDGGNRDDSNVTWDMGADESGLAAVFGVTGLSLTLSSVVSFWIFDD